MSYQTKKYYNDNLTYNKNPEGNTMEELTIRLNKLQSNNYYPNSDSFFDNKRKILIVTKQLKKALKNKRLKGEVKISGYYETAQNKIYQSKSVEFNIDDWKNVPLPPYSYP